MPDKITGYRELSEAEIQLINDIKAAGPVLEALVHRCEAAQADPRWLALGKTHLQQGLMALTRSVAKPEGF